MMLYLDCPLCGRPRQMEQPPCGDGHHLTDCPDRACVECGAGLVVDPILVRTRRERLARAA